MVNQQLKQSFTIAQAAEYLACSIPTVYRMINECELKFFRVRKDKRISLAELLRITGEAA